jgi:hypothetical protein
LVLPGNTEWPLKVWRLARINLLFIMTHYGDCPSFAHKLCLWFSPATVARVVAVAMVVLLAGCDREPGVKTSISQLEKAFAVPAGPGSAEQPAPDRAPRADAHSYVQTALRAVRSNDYAAAVLMLKAAVGAPGMTPDQFLAVQQTKDVLLSDLRNRARKGDARAQAALKSAEQVPWY